MCELLLIGGRKNVTEGDSSFSGGLSFFSGGGGLFCRGVAVVSRAFQSRFQEQLRARRAVQPAGAEDGPPGEGLLVPQDDGAGQGRG